MDHAHNAWVEVDLGAIRHNLEQLQKRVGEAVKIMAVVKANAYGHGLIETSRALVEAGVYALAVTRLDEAEALRNSGIISPILVFDSLQPELAGEAVKLGVDVTVCTPELITALGKAATAYNKTINVHLKIDTGMGRLGVLPENVVPIARQIAATEGVVHAGTYTHFATAAEKDLSQSKIQLDKFKDAVLAIKKAFLNPGLLHAANSAAILRLPEAAFDMVRTGNLLYGQYSSRYVPQLLDLRPTWKLKAKVSFVKSVPSHHGIGYGLEFVTKRESRIAVVTLGWADGLTLMPESLARRSLLRFIFSKVVRSPLMEVIIRGKKAPVVGRIAMQMFTVDVTHIPNADAGDEVIIPARRVTTSPNIPRIYTDQKE